MNKDIPLRRRFIACTVAFIAGVPLVSLLSLALLVALTWLCIDSRRQSHLLSFVTPAGNLQAAGSARVGIVLFFSDIPFGRGMALTADLWQIPADVGSTTRGYAFQNVIDAAERFYKRVGATATRVRTGPSGFPGFPSITASMATAEEITDGLCRIISEFVAPDSWMQAGGVEGRILHLGPILVAQTDTNHKRIVELVRALAMADKRADGVPTTQSVPRRENPDWPIAETDLDGVTLEAAVAALAEKSKCNIVPLWKQVEASGVNPRQTIRVHLWDTTVGRALNVLTGLASSSGSVSWRVQDGVILVAPADYLRNSVEQQIRIYNVRDLVENAIGYRADRVSHAEAAEPKPHPKITNQMGPFAGPVRSAETYSDAVEELSQLIERNFEPDSWQDNGGSIGDIREFGGMLVVRQTPAVHQKIARRPRSPRWWQQRGHGHQRASMKLWCRLSSLHERTL